MRKFTKMIEINRDPIWRSVLESLEEGIEVVEKLLEMVKKFQDKIEVTKPRL
jgi:hypothetical protein